MRPLRSIAWSAIAFLSGILLPAASSAAIMTFDNRGAFEAAVSGAALTADPFDNLISGADQILLDSGVTATNSSFSASPLDNAVTTPDGNGGFLYRATVSEPPVVLPDFVTWDFPVPVIGFGFELSGAAIGGLQVAFDGGNGQEAFVFSDIMDVLSGGFAGFVADTAFETIVFSSADKQLIELFFIDDLVFAEAVTAAVPSPTTLPLTLFGIAVLLFYRRKRALAASP